MHSWGLLGILLRANSEDAQLSLQRELLPFCLNAAGLDYQGAMNNTGAFFDSMTFDDDYASRHNRHRQAEIEGRFQDIGQGAVVKGRERV